MYLRAQFFHSGVHSADLEPSLRHTPSSEGHNQKSAMGLFTQKIKVPFGAMDAKWKIESSAKWKVQEEKWWQLEIGIFLNPNLPATSISSSPTFEVPRIQSPEPMYFITSQKRQMGDTDPEKYGNWVRCIPLQLVCVCVHGVLLHFHVHLCYFNSTCSWKFYQ